MEFLQQNIFMVLLALGSGGALLFLTLRSPGGRTGVSATQATLLINRENAVIIDVRGADEFAAGHLPGAHHIPLDEVAARAGEYVKSKDKPVLVVCQSGARSGGACKQLEQLGFTRVSNLDGGIGGWRAAGLPLKKGER